MGVAGEALGFNAMLWANFYDDTEIDGRSIDSYVLVNGSLNYRFTVTGHTYGQAFVRVFNLLDDKHREHPDGDAYGLMITAGFRFDW